MESKMVVVFGVFVAVFVQCVAAQTVHVVGDSLGWTIPQSGQQYVTWASANKFAVGDFLIMPDVIILLVRTTTWHCHVVVPYHSIISPHTRRSLIILQFFNFATNAHDVQEVPYASFDSCSSDNTIGSSITTGPANVTLTSAGDNYFICTYGTHCQSGQKLAITVSAAAPGASPSGPTSAPPPPPPPTTPPTTSITVLERPCCLCSSQAIVTITVHGWGGPTRVLPAP
ncbi:hypothetical protein PRUPE_3G086500 [Prunus persica]|uniref:Phytocyanin domain-containing protein n=1 Tax=Prunus persica TaxID=3760 RepID=A0A251PXC6_PRUPE|nr:hypothetical protein PRUPE_3G086500 [Prunus persica]